MIRSEKKGTVSRFQVGKAKKVTKLASVGDPVGIKPVLALAGAGAAPLRATVTEIPSASEFEGEAAETSIRSQFDVCSEDIAITRAVRAAGGAVERASQVCEPALPLLGGGNRHGVGAGGGGGRSRRWWLLTNA
jgi:hypothetical protein